MKLLPRLVLMLSLALVPLMLLWGTLFYYAMVGEINDEVDDALEQYADLIVERCREGRVLPSLNSGSNNSYTITPATDEDIALYFVPKFRDADVFIPEKREMEPARVMTKVFTADDGRYLKLEVATPTFEKHDLIETILLWSVALLALLLVAVVVVASFVYRRTLRPLYALLKWLEGYAPGQPYIPVPNNTHIREFRLLNEAAQSAVDRSEQQLQHEKQFIGNASHELQTPLAVIGNRVEYLINQTSPSEEQLAELIKIEQSVRHSVRLNRTLLLLMRIDGGHVEESEEVDFVTLVEEVSESCAEVYADRGLQCTTNCEFSAVNGGHLFIYMNESLARMLVVNLVKNAYIYTPDGGSISITLRDESLTVANDGSESLDATCVFDRFYTRSSRKAKGRTIASGTGLGLAIVKSIGEHYGFKVGYSFTNGRHCFEVRFK